MQSPPSNPGAEGGAVADRVGTSPAATAPPTPLRTAPALAGRFTADGGRRRLTGRVTPGGAHSQGAPADRSTVILDRWRPRAIRPGLTTLAFQPWEDQGARLGPCAPPVLRRSTVGKSTPGITQRLRWCCQNPISSMWAHPTTG